MNFMKSYFLDTKGYVAEQSSSIRSRFDVINALFSLVGYANIKELSCMSCEVSIADVYIHIDKMSRFFWKYDKSIHSAHFPFVLKESEGMLEVRYDNRVIDSKIVAVMKSLFCKGEKVVYDLECMFDYFYENMNSYSISNYDMDFYWQLFVYLITFETGYVRYDYDEERMDIQKHPLYHLDIFFSNKNTFKIGGGKNLNLEEFRKILDIQEICSQIH